MEPPRRLRVALIAPYGEPRDGFFADSLLAMLAAEVEARGHEARVLRVYYDGRDPAADERVRARLTEWLGALEPDLVAFERLFDPAPIRAHRARHRVTTALIWRGDSFDDFAGVDLAIGALPGASRRGETRRTPTIDELLLAFVRVVDALACGHEPQDVPGVVRFVAGEPLPGAPLERVPRPLPFRAIARQEVIAPGAAPRIVRKTIFGNAGCPYGDDPLVRPDFQRLRVPLDQPLSRLGCAFCFMGGDYEKRPDDEIVTYQIAQARFWTEAMPELEELVLTDQAPVRYLARLVEAAVAAGVRPIRWLFPARADSFLREREKVRQAARVAAARGHMIELYLTGFESFSDAELARYNKGLDAGVAIAAIAAMRAMAVDEPEGFAYARARGHSLILWSPWTTLDDLQTNVDALRAHGLGELFTDVGRNRLRLYRDLPVYWAAERDGLLTDRWEDGDEGGARRKGYSVEQPWRFARAETRLAFHLVRLLRDRLGPETELSQLAAVVAWVRGRSADELDPPAGGARLLGALDELDAALARAGHGGGRRAEPVASSGACNNGCLACAQRDRFEPSPVAAAARAKGPVVLVGREPTLHPRLPDLLRGARRHGPIAMVTNGRRFSVAGFAERVVQAGLRSVSVKLFGPDAETHDAIALDPGAFDQAVAGLGELVKTRRVAIELRFPLHRHNLARAAEMAEVARRLGIGALRVEADLFAVGFGALRDAARAVTALDSACRQRGVALRAESLTAGTVHPGHVPT